MKQNPFLRAILASCLAFAACSASATTWYVNDASTESDVYCSAAGNAANTGMSSNSPVLDVNSIAPSLAPGDTVYIDTGVYGQLSITNSGTAGQPIVFHGSPSGSSFLAEPDWWIGALDLIGDHLSVDGVIVHNSATHHEARGICVAGSGCILSNVCLFAKTGHGVFLDGAANLLANCVISGATRDALYVNRSDSGNAVRRCTFASTDASGIYTPHGGIAVLDHTVVSVGSFAFKEGSAYPQLVGHCVFYAGLGFHEGRSLFSVAETAKDSTNFLDNIDAPAPIGFTDDFCHLPSPAGHIVTTTNAAGLVVSREWVTDNTASLSLAVDAGDVMADVGEEPSPNGARLNVGAYAGTAEASKSPASASLALASFNGRANLIGSGTFRWIARNVTGNVVVGYSRDNGDTWTDLATVPATDEAYEFTATTEHSSPIARWRVVSASNPAVAVASSVPFSVRVSETDRFDYYVNDNSTENDIYCAAVGNDANAGTSSNAPKATLENLIDTYALRGGDTVYIDSGRYALTDEIAFPSTMRGQSGNYLRFVGASPALTVFEGNAVQWGCAFRLSGPAYLSFENLTISKAAYPFHLTSSHSNVVQNCAIHADTRWTMNNYGIYTVSSRGNVVRNCLIAGPGYGANASGCTFLNNVFAGNAFHIDGSGMFLTNNIFTDGGTAFNDFNNSCDYNLFDTNVTLCSVAGYATLEALSATGKGWSNSFVADPCFVDAASGDYHLLSSNGYYSASADTWVTNGAVHSPAIDRGLPTMDVAGEPQPNGGRINIGLHGGTARASKSAADPWLQVLSLTDGGTFEADGAGSVRWTGGNLPGGATVAIQLSRDGTSWEPVASGIDAAGGVWSYAAGDWPTGSAWSARWKIVLESDPSVESASTKPFVYKYGSFTYYVNDNSTDGDVYCTAIGSNDNAGVSPAAPKASLSAILSAYALSAGDVVKIDTGVYPADASSVATLANVAGEEANPVRIVGSTNFAAGGSVLGERLAVTESSCVDISALTLTNAIGLDLAGSSSISVHDVFFRRNATYGMRVADSCNGIDIAHVSALAPAVAFYVNLSTNVSLNHASIHGATSCAVVLTNRAALSVSNSAFSAFDDNASVYSIASGTTFASDCNGVHSAVNAFVGTCAGLACESLVSWVAASGQDVHSLGGDPLFADPENGDFHLCTTRTRGRFQPDGTRTADTVRSPLIAAGNPEADASAQLEPARVNIGRYGGTAEASLPPEAPWVQVATFLDAGGVTEAGDVTLRWLSGSGASGEAVVSVSVDGGFAWREVARVDDVTAGETTWTVAENDEDSPACRWRVALAADETVSSSTEKFFAIRKSPLVLYLNNYDTNDTVFTTAVGSSTNYRATADAPLDSLARAFELYDLEGGDTLKLDRGVYTESSDIRLTRKNTGTDAANPLVVSGLSSDRFSGAVLARSSRTRGYDSVSLSAAGAVLFENIAFSNNYNGVVADSCDAAVFRFVRFTHSAANGVLARGGSRLVLTNSLIASSSAHGLFVTGGVVRAENCLFRENATAAVLVDRPIQSGTSAGSLAVRNSVLSGGGTSVAYAVGSSNALSLLASDYNDVFMDKGTPVGRVGTASYRYLYDWQQATGLDARSVGFDPLFADEDAGDFHLRSAFGRYAAGDWVSDPDTSALIDLADPASGCEAEPSPNGSRCNIGLYGGTDEASKSAGDTVQNVTPLTMSDGGVARGEVTLYWDYNGFAGNEYCCIDASFDGGTTWTNVATDLYLNREGGYIWDVSGIPSTAQALWRISVLEGGSVVATGTTEAFFSIKNEPLVYYVNDASTAGDVYCSASGSAANDGLSTNTPLDSIETVFKNYQIDAGDTIYVDTGTYVLLDTLAISQKDPEATNRLAVVGSDNFAAGGTILTNARSSNVLVSVSGSFVDFRNFTLRGSPCGLRLTEARSNRISSVTSIGAETTAFELGENAGFNEFVNCAALDFGYTGLVQNAATAQTAVPQTNAWINGVFANLERERANHAVSLVGAADGLLRVTNSVFVVRSAPSVHCFNGPTNCFTSDYNCFDRNGFPLAAAPLAGVGYGVRTRYAGNLEDWRELSGNDRNSFEADPLFTALDACNLAIATNSPLIDTGDPSVAAWANEPAPNGGRVNIGAFGGTPFARTTPTDFGFTVLLSYAKGGTASGTVPLRWAAVGLAGNASYTLKAQVSPDGNTWLDQGSVSGPSGEVPWDSTALVSSPKWQWRVVSDRGDLVPATESEPFVLHNDPIVYYVNDDYDADKDVYCTAAGASAFDGLSPATPLDSIDDVLSRYDLAPGDLVKVDTGTYPLPSVLSISPFDGGSMASPVRLVGSTNRAAGGTVFTGYGLSANSVEGFAMSDVVFAAQIRKAGAIELHDVQGISLDRVDVQGSLGDGILLNVASNVHLRNVSVARATSNGVFAAATADSHILRSTIWSNALGAVSLHASQMQGSSPLQSNSTLSVRSSILGSSGTRVPVFRNEGTRLSSDYNAISASDGALVGLVAATPLDLEYDTLVRWSAATSNDVHTLSQDPLFRSPRDYDFHLQSAGGRWTAAGIVSDPETSPLLDAGDPDDAAYGNELAPNGGRINIGRYAGTSEGSATPEGSRLTLISLNDGGSISGTNTVFWVSSGPAAAGPVTLSYSTDNGTTWTEIATLPAGTTEYEWDVSGIQSVATLLRLEAADGTGAQSENSFAIRSQPYKFYINDDSTAGDIYCSAVGSAANTGLSTNSPLRDLNDLLARYDLEAGDVVCIDTGLYENPPTRPWVISQQDSAYGAWERGGDVVFQGSTNRAAGGTVIGAGGGETALRLEYVQGVTLRHLILSNATSTNAATAAALSVSNALHCTFEWLEARDSSYGYGFYGCSNLWLNHSLARSVDVGAYVNAYDASISNCVFWMPAVGPALSIDGRYAVSLSDSVLTATNGAYIFSISEYATLESDYNAYLLSDGARVCQVTHASTNSPVPTVHETVARWTAATNRDVHSYSGTDLGFADPASGDFHLLSTAGRWNGNGWTNDAASSPLIDMGNPQTDASAEPDGGRVDIGLYGGTAEASRTPSDDGITLLSFNRGGIASNRVVFAWIPLGNVTSHTVRVELSHDGGGTWETLARGIAASEGELVWNSGSLASPRCYWRVGDEVDSAISVTNALPFTLHNRGISYYANDDDTADDVYCRAVGSALADGLSPDAPMLGLQAVVDTYDLEPGDTVYIDTGYYYLEKPVEIGDLDCGTISTARTSQVVFQGSTNRLGEGTFFWHGNTNEAGILVKENAVGLRFSDLNFSSGSAAVRAQSAYFLDFDWLDVDGAVDGLAFSGGSDVHVTHSQFRNCPHAGIWFDSSRDSKRQTHATVDVDSSVFWNNRFGVYLQSGYLAMTHSVMGLLDDGQIGYLRRSDGQGSGFAGDYNDIYVATNTAFAAAVQNGQEDRATTRSTTYASVSRLQEFFESDLHSLSHNPLFADPDRGDFHLSSAAGRWEAGTWETDGESSPLIDSGNPADIAWAAEPAPNGRRRNIGRYGGSAFASRSDAAGTLVLSSLNDGGNASGEVLLTWIARGDITNAAVVIEYSPDDGITWLEVASGIPSTDGAYVWDSVSYGSSALSRWCVHGESPYESVSATSESAFTLRNSGSIRYYVNDGYDAGTDVYCTAAGNDRNDGLTPATPKASIESVLETYDLDPEDRILVDAGMYSVGSPAIEITQADAGYTNAAGEKFFVTLQGSTNPVAPTVLAARSALSPVLFSISHADCVRFRDLVLSNGLVAVSGNYADGIEFERVRFETSRDCALSLSYAKGWTMTNCIFRLPATNALALANSDAAIDSSVLWCTANVFGLGSGASLSVSNSVLRASGASSRVYPVPHTVTATNAIRADYNDYVRDNAAVLLEQVRQSGGSVTYDTVGAWHAASGQDAHSMVLDPLFADAAAGDFHPRSAAGRFLVATNEETGLPAAVWTNDFAGIRSPLIDAGAPGAAWAEEPDPNGGIRNIGAFGNTAQASKSIETPWIQAVSYNSGETIAGTAVLYWTYGGTNDNTLVEIAYSEDGSLWHEAMATVPVSAREYRWDTTAIRMLPHVKWRVRTVDYALEDISDDFSPIRNGTSKFYVNDDSLEGDLWCTNAVGAAFGTTNSLGIVVSGTNALCPLRSLQEVLDNYPVGAGDTVYVDTGTYTDPVLFTIDNAGNATAPLAVCGSTNGTRFAIASSTANAVGFVNTANITVSDIEVVGGLNAWYLENASDISLSRVSAVSAASNGILALNAADFALRNALVVSNRAAGYRTGNNQGGSRSVDFATFAANGDGIVNEGTGGLTVSNSVLVATNGVLYAYPAQIASITGDYNLYALTDSAALAYDFSSRSTYVDLSQWAAKAGESHSVVLGDPLFADAASGDYHLASQAGSWHGGTWEADAETSWGIDFADPDAATANNRANAGAYGGTDRESKTCAASPALQVLTFADGGTSSNGVALRWASRGIAPSSPVRISYHNGSGWIVVGTTTAGADGFYWWTTDEPSPESRWKVELAENPAIFSESAQFSFRPKPISYYVNDASTQGDVYCSAPGSAANLGYRTNSPLDSVQTVLDRFALVGGDAIYVDTGEYALAEPVEWTAADSGDGENGPVSLIGSTNAAAGGTVFREVAGRKVATAFTFPYAVQDVRLGHFACEGFDTAVASGQNCQSLAFEDLHFRASRGTAIANGQGNGFMLSRVIVSHAGTNGIALEKASRTTISNCVFYLVASNAVAISDSSQTTVTNCIFVASGEGAACYRMGEAGDLPAADYNDLYLVDNAVVGVLSGVQYESVPQWVKYTSRDLHSLNADPLFADPDAADFHLRSTTGRYDPLSGGWTNDAVHSPCIDTGLPDASAVGEEPVPNGGRIDMGAFGGTWQASKSDTEDWVQAVSAMGGGIMSGTITLVWNYGGTYLDPAGQATLSYSPDNGRTWKLIATTTLSNGLYRWVSTKTSGGTAIWPSSPGALWSIQSGGASNQTAYFGLRNEPFKYYVNDASLEDDSWCEAVGDDENLGYWPSAPKRTLENLLASIDAEPGDGIYIDTGTYPMETNIAWNASDGGENGSFVHAYGSPNGVWFTATTSHTFQVDANYTDISGLNFEGPSGNAYAINLAFTGTGLAVSNCELRNASLAVAGNEGMYDAFRLDRRGATLAGTNNLLRGLHLASGTATLDGSGNALQNSVIHAAGNSETGLLVRAASAVVTNCTVESERGTAIAFANPAGAFRLGGSILVAGGTDDDNAVLVWESGALESDWNDLVARNGAWVGIHDGDKWERLAYWQDATGVDAHSIALEPLFVADGADFHLDSTTGRWDDGTGQFVPGGADSPCIDAGDPAVPYAREVRPHGNRINLGAYGNTPFASLSSRSNYVVAVSPSDGGAVSGTVDLVWAAPYGHNGTVALYYRSGTEWVEIASGLPAGDGRYAWDTDGLNLFATQWKIVDDAGNECVCETPFDVRNRPQDFFVNDGTVDAPDGYCTAAGNDANDGLTPATPKATLAALLAAYDLEPGDTVFIDKGRYPLSATTRLIWSAGGDGTNPVSIVGYPLERSTWFTRASGVPGNTVVTALDLKPDHVVVSNFSFGGVDRAVLCDRTAGTDIGYLFVSNAATGVEALSAEGLSLSHSGFFNVSKAVVLSNTVGAEIVNNTFVARDVAPAGVSIDLKDTTDQGVVLKNNIFEQHGYSYAYGIHDEPDQLSGDHGAVVDYNLYDFVSEDDGEGGAIKPSYYHGAAVRCPALMDWQLAANNDYRSATNAAALAETEARYALDFHPLSAYGRRTASGWTADPVTSFAVDHGDIAQDVGDEPDENSGRINIGMYGGTAQASKGSGEPGYETRSLTGEAGETIPLVMGKTYVLVWSSEGFDSNKLVNVEFFNGTAWVTLASGIPAWQEYILFTPDQTYMTANGRWRVSTAGNPDESATSEGDLSMRYADIRIIPETLKMVNGRMRFTWEGGIGGKEYWILYSDDGGRTWHAWSDEENGPAFLNRNHFTFTTTQEKYVFEDRTSYGTDHRWYRIIETDIGEDDLIRPYVVDE
ncbi:MAG: right-handed parallel beta-helix repeat-containing protein [Kiritimatiellae bacterium]|nr:right-handed parallel beta-helix repeat-containing protein [Kiritimatiellia bacterium]